MSTIFMVFSFTGQLVSLTLYLWPTYKAKLIAKYYQLVLQAKKNSSYMFVHSIGRLKLIYEFM